MLKQQKALVKTTKNWNNSQFFYKILFHFFYIFNSHLGTDFGIQGNTFGQLVASINFQKRFNKITKKRKYFPKSFNISFFIRRKLISQVKMKFKYCPPPCTDSSQGCVFFFYSKTIDSSQYGSWFFKIRFTQVLTVENC